MPINYKNYHPMWKRISRFVRLIRAQNCCEKCGVPNYSVLEYLSGEVVEIMEFDDIQAARAYRAEKNKFSFVVNGQGQWWSMVILTVAHLDHDVDNNDLDNLQALCQRCHLGHDRRDNAQKRRYGPTGRFHRQLVMAL